MSYRDEMQAALERIASLEAILKERSEDADPEVRAELEAARQEIAELQALLLERTAEQETIERQLVDMRERVARAEQGSAGSPRSARAEIPSLFDHNRGFPPITTGKPAGVICPLCHAAGERVEMRRKIGHAIATSVDDETAFDFTNVCCPRCMLMTFMRLPLPRRG